MKKIHKICPFVGIEIDVLTDRNEWKKYIEKHGHSSDPNNISGKAFWLEKNGVNKFAIGLFVDEAETCVHEASHIVTFIMECYSIEDDEFRAYMCGYISQELFNICEKSFNVDKT